MNVEVEKELLRLRLKNHVEAFIFDLDGVIADTSKDHFFAWKTLVKELGIDLEDHVNEQLKGVSRLDSLNVILKEYGRENDFSHAEKVEMMTRKNNHYLELIRQYDQENLLPGVYELLELLHKKGLKCAVASASKSAPMLIEAMNIRQFINYTVDPSHIPGKPAPDLFLAAAKQFKVNPVLCIGVEDAVAGIRSIKEAGMFSIGIGDKSILTEADCVFSSPLELFHLIETSTINH